MLLAFPSFSDFVNTENRIISIFDRIYVSYRASALWLRATSMTMGQAPGSRSYSPGSGERENRTSSDKCWDRNESACGGRTVRLAKNRSMELPGEKLAVGVERGGDRGQEAEPGGRGGPVLGGRPREVVEQIAARVPAHCARDILLLVTREGRAEHSGGWSRCVPDTEPRRRVNVRLGLGIGPWTAILPLSARRVSLSAADLARVSRGRWWGGLRD